MGRIGSIKRKLSKRDLQDQLNDLNERYYRLEQMLYALAEHCKCFISSTPVVVPYDPPKSVKK